MRILLAALMVIASVYGAMAQFNGCMPGLCPSAFSFGFGPGGGGGGPQPTGKILLVDGVSFILQVDAASKICRAGGC